MKKLSVYEYAKLKKKTPAWVYLTIEKGTFNKYFPDAKVEIEQKELIRIVIES